MWYGDQFGAPQGITDRFRMAGDELCRLTLDDFKQRSKDAGPNFHAQLDVWKNGKWRKKYLISLDQIFH